MDLNHFFTVSTLHPRRDGRGVDRHDVGKFYHDGRTCAVLADHIGLLEDLPHEGPSTPEVRRRIEQLHNASYLQLRNPTPEPAELPGSDGAGAPAQGQEAPVPTAPEVPVVPARLPSVFDYHRAGMDKPHTIEFHGGIAHLDGKALAPEETQTVLQNVTTGVATLRHRVSGAQNMTSMPMTKSTPIQKMEEALIELSKAEGSSLGLADHMERMRQLVTAGHLPHETYDRIRRELFADDMTGLGNKRAYHEHLEGNPGGVHVMLDSNGLKAMNDSLGHEAGDAAIKATGGALRSAIDKTVGSEQAKAWRLGGDEFGFHVPTHEHAGAVLRQLRHELEAVPPIGGTHPLSVSAGIGHSPAVADKALYHAKAQKLDAIRAAGGDPADRTALPPHTMYVHSLHPGHEGPVPTAEPSPLTAIPPAPAPAQNSNETPKPT